MCGSILCGRLDDLPGYVLDSLEDYRTKNVTAFLKPLSRPRELARIERVCHTARVVRPILPTKPADDVQFRILYRFSEVGSQ